MTTAPAQTVRLTVAQATLRFLVNQYSERDGVEQRLLGGFDEQRDVELCAEIGVRWIATNHPADVRDWLVTV